MNSKGLSAVVLTAIAMAVPGAAADAAPPDAVRTSHAYAIDDAKVAVVASRTNRAGKVFKVVRTSDGVVVQTGKLVAAPGTAAPWATATHADVSALRTPGTFRVDVGTLVGRPFIVGGDPSGELLAEALNLYNANRDGDEPSRSHGVAHLSDRTAPIANGPRRGQTMNISGGFADSGDQLKFTFTIAQSAIDLQHAARLQPTLADALNAEADVAIRWLLKAHPDPQTFVLSVGDVRDHTEFRDPATDDASGRPGIARRPVLVMDGVTGGSDAAGKAAAALALAAQRTPAGSQRDRLLTAAREWHAKAVATNLRWVKAWDGSGSTDPIGGGLVDQGFYPNDNFADDLANAELELWRAGGDAGLAHQALDRIAGYWEGELGVSSYDSGGLVAADVCGALGRPTGDAALRDRGCAELARAAGFARDKSRENAFGRPADILWGSNRETASRGAILALAGRAGVRADGLRQAAGARDFLLGRNSWGRSFFVGIGQSPAQNPHHWARSLFGAGNPRGSLVGGPGQLGDIRGATPGFRPTQYDSTAGGYYQDVTGDYVTNEVSIDYSAPALVLLAALSDG